MDDLDLDSESEVEIVDVVNVRMGEVFKVEVILVFVDDYYFL